MLKILDLSPDEVEFHDPFHYGRDKLAIRFPSTAYFQPPSRLFTWSPDQFLRAYLPRFCSDADRVGRHAPIVRYDIEMSKKYGPQGGHFTRATLEATLKQSYEFADVSRTYELVLRGSQAMCSMIRARIDRVGYPSCSYAPLVQDTAAGLPRGGRKTEWRNHVDGADNWRHVQDDLPNGRRQRSKDRVIHEDSVLNVDYVEPYLSAVRNWLKTEFPEIFAGWINPQLVLWPMVTSHLLRGDSFLETDYSAMDNHFSWDTVQRVVLPIYQCLLTDAEYMHFASFVEELFSQPVFLGDTLWTGLHNLFSGQGITNDFETYYDVCLYLGCHLTAGGSVSTFLSRFAAVGDDVLYSNTRDMCLRVYELVVKEATANGLVLSTEKTRIQSGEARFLRQVYYDALPRRVNRDGKEFIWPAYPPILAMNSIVQPEHPADNVSQELLSDFTRLDGITGYYRRVDVAQLLYSHMQELPLAASLDAEFEVMQMRDWWFKVYGTTYSLGESWSAELYRDHFHQYRLPAVIY